MSKTLRLPADLKRARAAFEDDGRENCQRRRVDKDLPMVAQSDDSDNSEHRTQIIHLVKSPRSDDLDDPREPPDAPDQISIDVEMVDFGTPSTIDNSESEICYGMICEGQASFCEGFSLSKDAFDEFFGPNCRSHPSMSIHEVSGAYALRHDISAVDAAILDTRISKHVRQIFQIGTLRIQAFVDKSKVFDGSMNKTINTEYATIPMLLVLYGKRAIAEAIGKSLSESRVYLQHPIQIDPEISYENPHYYDPRTATKPDRDSSITSSIAEPIVQQYLPLVTIVENVLQTLERDTPMQQINPDIRVETKLMRHQKQALNFILQREDGIVEEDFSLWKFKGTPFGPLYQHCITGIKVEHHPGDSRGGLLADEMGLGKTLSIISAIVNTLKQARSFQTNLGVQSAKHRQSRATLVLAPSAVLLDGWVAEIDKHVRKDTLKVHKFHGQKKEVCLKNLLNYDVVVTTFATLSADYSKASSILRDVSWFRLVVDEAHILRNQGTKHFKTVLGLRASRRWLLSGTPVQNSLDDLGALVRLLGIPEFENKTIFQRLIVAPLRKDIPDNTKNLRLLLNSICLRRLSSSLNIPAITYRVQRLDLSAEERQMYEKILDKSSKEIEDAVSTKSSFAAYSIILQAILRTRMLCDHGTFQRAPGTSRLGTPTTEKADILACIQDGDEELSLVDTSWDGSSQSNPSPSNFTGTGNCTKLKALVKNLREESTGKSIVFSCWKTTLDLAEFFLRSHGIKFIRIDGSIAGAERSKILCRFDTDASIKVILMTTGTGAVGLNLTIANQVHILEPQWNPSIEMQAIGRVVRLNQKQAVTVTRYITNNTVEQAVQDRQMKKLELAELTLNENTGSEDQMQQRLQNLRSLLYK